METLSNNMQIEILTDTLARLRQESFRAQSGICFHLSGAIRHYVYAHNLLPQNFTGYDPLFYGLWHSWPKLYIEAPPAQDRPSSGVYWYDVSSSEAKEKRITAILNTIYRLEHDTPTIKGTIDVAVALMGSSTRLDVLKGKAMLATCSYLLNEAGRDLYDYFEPKRDSFEAYC